MKKVISIKERPKKLKLLKRKKSKDDWNFQNSSDKKRQRKRKCIFSKDTKPNKYNLKYRENTKKYEIFRELDFIDDEEEEMQVSNTPIKVNKIKIQRPNQINLKNKNKNKQIQDMQQNEDNIIFDFYMLEEQKIKKKNVWDTSWDERKKILRAKSPYGHFDSYKLRPLIIKGGDDLRQELICMQIMQKLKNIFEKGGINLWLYTYDIIVISANSGIIEFIPDTISLDGLKKKTKNTGLFNFYKETFLDFKEAQKNFIESLAGYSLFQYILQLKDRHNGNILIDAQGHIIHIDFGFLFGTSPGGGWINFENAPFKLTSEYLELMGGKDSEMFAYFKILLWTGFLELRKYANDIVYLVEIMREGSDLPCFQYFDLKQFRSRFMENKSDQECMVFVESMLYYSAENWRTVQYDNFQKITNGILP